MTQGDVDKPCWVWDGGDWREGFVIRWFQTWDDDWKGYCEWTREEEGGVSRRGSVHKDYLRERVSDDPRGRGGVKPPPLGG